MLLTLKNANNWQIKYLERTHQCGSLTREKKSQINQKICLLLQCWRKYIIYFHYFKISITTQVNKSTSEIIFKVYLNIVLNQNLWLTNIQVILERICEMVVTFERDSNFFWVDLIMTNIINWEGTCWKKLCLFRKQKNLFKLI